MDNERIKLAATFYNNLGIGLVLVGAVVPYFTLWRPLSEFLYAFAAGIRPLPPPAEESVVLFPTLGIAVSGMALAVACRFLANHKIKKWQEPSRRRSRDNASDY